MSPAGPTDPPPRLVALDAMRGAVMALLVCGALLGGLASRFSQVPVLGWLDGHFEHAAWAGFTLWDLIEPAFILLIGVSLPFSCAARRARGEPLWRTRLHVLKRSAIFLALGLLITSLGHDETRFRFTGLLSQVALAYPFAFALVGLGRRLQIAATAGILLAWWLAFVLHPLPPAGADFGSLGIQPEVEPMTGLFAHWNRGTNFSARIDLWLLNLLHGAEPYRYDAMGNQTLNFVPRIATMALGVMAGEHLRGPGSAADQGRHLAAAGLALGVAGFAAGQTATPLVKYLWTSSWTLLSGGIGLLTLAAFLAWVDVLGWKRSVLPFRVLGMNSIAAYLMYAITAPWLVGVSATHLPDSWALHQLAAVVAIWGACGWMYRRGIFLKV